MEKFWKMYQTLYEMLKDRGYDQVVSGTKITDKEDLYRDYVVNGEVIDKASLNFVCQHQLHQGLLTVNFLSDPSIGVKQITKVYEKMITGKIPHCIFIYPNILTPSAKRDLEKIQKVVMEYFSEDELQMNITKHQFMPKYEVLNEEDKKSFLVTLKVQDHQLPRISVTDPAAKYYGMRRGDIVRIIRKSETAGHAVMYRICN